MSHLTTQLHENAGNMFRQGWFKVEAVAVIPNSLNCDVPFISGDVGSQILRTVTDPATVSNASAGAPAGAAATAGDATAATDAAAEPAAGGSRTVHFLPMVSEDVAFCCSSAVLLGCLYGRVCNANCMLRITLDFILLVSAG